MKLKWIKLLLFVILTVLLFNLWCLKSKNANIIEVFFNQENNPYFIHIDLDDYIMYVFKDKELYKTYPVSGGAPHMPSPLGTWKIISKADWGEGFGGTWMGFNVPWGKYGIHGTDEPWSIGKGMSKGCIRMYNEDARELKKYIPYGTKVNIVKGVLGPFGTGFRNLEPGDIGSDVYAVQKKLQELGYYNGWVDGKFGDGMKRAINEYQKEHNLTRTINITKELYESLGLIPFE